METVGGRLVRSLSGPDTATISVFDLESGSPQPMWEKEIDAGLSWLDTWEDRILAGDTLLDINTGAPPKRRGQLMPGSPLRAAARSPASRQPAPCGPP